MLCCFASALGHGNDTWTANQAALRVATGVTFNAADSNVRVDALTGGGTITSGASQSNLGYQNFAFGVANGSGTFAGVLANNGAHAGAFVKTGTGAQTLTGASTYTGSTTVSAGSLIVDGSLANTAVSVSAGATLGGSGTFGGLVTFASGAQLAPGSSPGTMTYQNGLTLLSGTILNFELGTTGDLILLTGGTLTGPDGTGGLTLNISNAGGFAAGTYTLFDFSASGVTTNSFDLGDFTFGSTISGFDYGLAFNGNTLALTAAVSAVPEPSTYAALLGLGALGFAAWRRRFRG